VARFWKTAALIVATAYFVVDGVLSYATRPITVWIARRNVFERTRRWIVSLRPYPALALVVVPVVILEPAKPLAVYLMGIGHVGAGAITFFTAELLKLTLVERLFRLNRRKLLSLPAFALGYRYWRQMMDLLESTEAWRASRALVDNAGHSLRTRWLQIKRVRHLQLRLYHK